MIISNSFFINALMFKDNTAQDIFTLNCHFYTYNKYKWDNDDYIDDWNTDAVVDYVYYFTNINSIDYIKYCVNKYGFDEMIKRIDYYTGCCDDFSTKTDDDYRDLYSGFLEICINEYMPL